MFVQRLSRFVPRVTCANEWYGKDCGTALCTCRAHDASKDYILSPDPAHVTIVCCMRKNRNVQRALQMLCVMLSVCRPVEDQQQQWI